MRGLTDAEYERMCRATNGVCERWSPTDWTAKTEMVRLGDRGLLAQVECGRPGCPSPSGTHAHVTPRGKLAMRIYECVRNGRVA